MASGASAAGVRVRALLGPMLTGSMHAASTRAQLPITARLVAWHARLLGFQEPTAIGEVATA